MNSTLFCTKPVGFGTFPHVLTAVQYGATMQSSLRLKRPHNARNDTLPVNVSRRLRIRGLRQIRRVSRPYPASTEPKVFVRSVASPRIVLSFAALFEAKVRNGYI
jgi:hypothetical protein